VGDLLVVAGVVLVVLLVVGGLVASRYRVAGPNQAFIITGRKGRRGPVVNPETGEATHDLSGQRVIIGASTFVLPIIQKLHSLDLSSRRIPVGISGAISAQGIKVDLEGVAIVKVGGTEEAIRAAAQRFLDQQQGIEAFTQEVLAGSLRAIVGRLTVETIIRDRAAFATAVAEEAEASLTGQGLALDTFQLQDIRAEGDYLKDLGRPEAARVQQVAAIAEAKARQAAEEERLRAEEQIAIAQRTLALKQAEIQAETDAALAQAQSSGPLAQAAKDQEVIAAQEQVATRRAALKERELDTEVRKPADAERYRVEQEAEAHKSAAIREAEAERARREAAAIALQREGEAEAAAILARGQAQAEARRRNAEAFATYGEAATLELLTGVLPDLVRAASEPIGRIKELTVVSTDGSSRLVGDVAANLEQGLAIGSTVTGVDLKGLLARLGGGRRDGAVDELPMPPA
jgi:flotillin